MVWQRPPQPHTLATDAAIKSPTNHYLNIIYDRNIASETIHFMYFHFQLPGESCDQPVSLSTLEKEQVAKAKWLLD